MFLKVLHQSYRKKVILTSSNLCRQIATDCYGRSAVFLLISMDHPLNEVLAVLKTHLVLQHLSELCDHLGDPATKEIKINDSEYCRVITTNKNWYRWPLVPKFPGSNPTEAVGFLRAKKSYAHLPLEGK